MGKCCVAGAGDLVIDEKSKTVSIKGLTLKEGDYLTLDGATGEVFKDSLAVVDPELSGDFETLMNLADKYRKL
jgi:pyruvate,orthophosphate dikinase